MATALLACALAACGSPERHRTSIAASQATSPVRTALGPTATATPIAAPSRQLFGFSVQHRPLVVYRVGQATGPVRALVIGVIHGDEVAGEPIARMLLTKWQPSYNGALVVVPELNPDGVARHTRQNAHLVDLNRNFPYAWQRIGKPHDQQYSGTGPLSEPEATAMAALIRRLRPAITVWFHQPVDVVDLSGGSTAIEQRFAQLLSEPTKRLTTYPGSVTRWQNATFPGTTAFVVELPRTVTPSQAANALTALLDLRR